MATQNDSTFREGQSTTRPPYFDGNDYPYWKTRMRIYLQALDYEIWEIVNDGPFMPLTKNEVGEDIPKPSRDWNEFKKRKASLNSKAMNALFCALDKKEFHRVSVAKVLMRFGTNLKLSMKARTKFTDIVNALGALGNTFSNNEKVKKIIRSLPKEWRPKRTAIEEAKDLNVLPIDDLIGFLISYEEDLAAEKGYEEKKKNIALKASKQCPLLNKLKKKAMVATWDDSDEDDRQEMTNLALIAVGEESSDELDEGLKKKKNKWYLDNGCSRHMTGNYSWFSSFTKIENGGDVSFGDNSKGKIIGIGNVVNTACYVLNRVLIRPNLNKTPYELWKDRKPNIGYFKVFGCKCFVLNTKDNLGKFDLKSDVGIFLGYSNSSKAYRVYNKRTLIVEEFMHVTFDESNPSSTEKVVVDDNAEEEQQEEASNDNQEDAPHGIQEEHHEETNAEQNEGTSQTLPKELRYVSSHPKDVILGDPSRGVTTRSSLRNTCEHAAFISQIEPKSFADEENDESWIMAMQEELNQFERNNVWELVPNPEHQSIIGTKWVFRNKMDESGVVVRNKARLVAQGYNQEEGIDFDETFAPVASTPMSTTIKLDKDEKGKEVDIKIYRGMIESLLYLTASRPDIMFSVCLCARFQSCPKESHILAVKRIFRYLIGTINLGLWYPRGTHIDLTCYSNADFAGYKVDRKSTSGTCHFLGHSLVSWFSKKQNSVALSTTEAE
ncbi:Integrase catalytic domain-containing protein [Citrus sinensis]|uniref:Integrase catalytic domain-containing protein n=1 Tax=Citrus sinensis TaxID=2711 RepID=A0ACB8N4B6_CITSI|nr:Integrase catalytic domain-containing protein [Citrus sinensis]